MTVDIHCKYTLHSGKKVCTFFMGEPLKIHSELKFRSLTTHPDVDGGIGDI